MKSIALADALKLGAVGCTGLFAGNAMYINLVDIPSKINLDIRFLLSSWKDAFHRAKKIQGGLVILGSACGYGAYYFEVPSNRCKMYLIASTAFLSLWPWTLFFMFPDIGKLCAEDCLEKRDEAWIRDHIRAWNTKHMVRTVVSLVSFGAFTFALWVHG
ncbi:hypothetical protein ACJMK2_024401 [Sinanodonta woodiana]|uniref:Uncharacterized protein n=1 Tax=Sinanodonta woodiana TaxID=1069815 RepID=A0ABD3T786_SINWO